MTYPRRVNTLAVITAVAFITGAGVMLLYSPLRHMESGDSAGYDYMAQSILRGQVPYRDAIDSKGPGSLYLSALVMLVGRAFGIQDIIAVRLFYVLLAGVFSALVYLVALAYLRSHLAATIAFAIPLVSEQFAEMVVEGTRPKIPMIIFGLLALLLIAKDKPFWAGFFSMLSCLCWQPGLVFTAVSALMFSRYLTSWRDLRALKALIGAAIPLAVVVSYFRAVGALGDLWTWTVHYNYSVYLPEAKVPATVALAQVWRLSRLAMGANIIWVELSIAGLAMYTASRLRARLKSRKVIAPPELFKDAIVIPPLAHLIFSMVNWQGEETLIIFFPFIGMFAAYFVLTIVRIVGSARFINQNRNAARAMRWSPVLAVLIIGVSIVRHAAAYRLAPGRTLQDQAAAFETVSEILGPTDKVYVHGTVELLVFLNRPNMNPYIFLPYGKDDYIASRLPGGFNAIVDQMEAQAPKVIALSRLRTVSHRDELLQWAAEHYEPFPLDFGHDSVYVRAHR
ncbi:MAG TPA: DolP-mannose mannosyltransferase [Blastocatellia bacterium]